MAEKPDRSRKAAKKSPRERPAPRVQAPWPDPEARQQMSEAEAEINNPGKHSKNPDWEKKW